MPIRADITHGVLDITHLVCAQHVYGRKGSVEKEASQTFSMKEFEEADHILKM